MEKFRKKTATIALVLVLTVSAILLALPIVGAHDPPWEVPTLCYISFTNNPIGVGQEVVIVYWSSLMPPTAQGAYGDRWAFTIEVTKPDNSKQTLGPYTSDPVGGGWTSYTPTQVGSYTFVAKVAEHTVTGLPAPPTGIYNPDSVNDIYLASTSDPVALTVQEDPIEAWEETPLPEEYWTRPINSMNREWWRIAGNWLAGAAMVDGPTYRTNQASAPSVVNPYSTGPESAHVMWATPMWAGGIMDGRFGNTGYQTSHYEGIGFIPPIILNGKIYYNVRSLPREGWYCLDLYTGEELYFHNTTGPVTGVSPSSSGSISGEYLAFGQILDFECPNQHGGFPYLWSTAGNAPNTWMMFDAYSGSYICSIENVPSWVSSGLPGPPGRGTAVYGKDGSILSYYLVGTPNPMGPRYPDMPPFHLQCWNTTQAIWWRGTQQQYQAGDYSEFPSNSYWMWRPGLNVTYDGSHGYSLNVSIPDVQGSIRAVREGEIIIGGTSGKNNGTYLLEGHLWALSLERGKEGTLLWNRTFTPPQTALPDIAVGTGYRGGVMSGPWVDPEDGVFYFSDSLTLRRWGYSLETGELLWGPSEPEAAGNYYAMSDVVYQGKLFSYGYGGQLVAYNITTGEVLWTYTAKQEGFESPYGNYPLFLDCIADGKIYMFSGEHSPSQPLWRGSQIRCIDTKTGEELWKIHHWEGAEAPGLNVNEKGAVIADGFLVGLNLYDNRIYCYGKGPSATTVTAEPAIVAKGSSVLIKGTVADESAGAKKLVEEGKSSIVPAIADEDMTEWMEYLYMQQQMPMDATGVKVTLDAVDPNGNFINIGTATSDMSGFYSYKWTPEHEGKYTIIATFEGSKAYYSSYAETAIGVDPAPAPSGPIEPEPTEPAEAPFITIEVAIIAAVVVVAIIGIVAYWQLRKRK
jgi:outer membrane protein assembly factor BamB